jgi:EAL and modified HD-GYP domain-containing signal transduction protein
MENNNNDDIFIARQPILTSKLDLYGYELFSRSTKDSVSSDIVHTEKTDAELLFNVLSTYDIESLLGGKFAFLNCELESMSVDHFEMVSPTFVVLEIKRPKNISGDVVENITTKLEELKSKGYRIASDDFIFEDLFSKWLPFIEIIKIQANNQTSANLKTIKKAKEANKKIVAELVETQEQYGFYKDFNVDYFQGYFFCKPVTLSAKVTSPAVANIISLINLTIKGAEFKEIEAVIKRDPTISFKLLRYINSAGVGLMCHIESFKHAIMILGYKKLFKWLTVLLSLSNKNPGSEVITKHALARARFMELVAEQIYPKDAVDNCFVIGIFSMLDVMLNIPLDVAIGSINLSSNIADTLLLKETEYSPLYNLMLALEKNDWIEILSLTQELRIPPNEVSELQLEAIEWSNKINISE